MGLAPQGPHKKVEAQRRRWTFYETIKNHSKERIECQRKPCLTKGAPPRSEQGSFFYSRIGHPSGRGVLCSEKTLIRSGPGNSLSRLTGEGKKALSERGGISSVPQMEKGTIGTRGWRANGKKRGPSSLKRGGPGTGSAKGFRIRAGMTRAAVRRAAETIRRRTRRKAQIWKGGFFPLRAAAIDGAKGRTADLSGPARTFPSGVTTTS